MHTFSSFTVRWDNIEDVPTAPTNTYKTCNLKNNKTPLLYCVMHILQLGRFFCQD